MTTHRPVELIAGRPPQLPEHEAWRLLAAATGRSRSDLLRGDPVDDELAAWFGALMQRRSEGVPLQYLEGTTQFGPLELGIDARALVPRPETEQLWELATGLVEDPAVIVDLCTGSGNLALALKYRYPGATVYGSDVSASALALARENGVRTGLAVSWYRGDLFGPLPASLRGRVDLLVANPPYVSEAEYPTLPVDVRDHEPARALVAGPLGTEVVSRIGREAPNWLAPEGWVVCEIGETQREAAGSAFGSLRFEVRHDLAGRDRFVVARLRSAGGGDPGPRLR